VEILLKQNYYDSELNDYSDYIATNYQKEQECRTFIYYLEIHLKNISIFKIILYKFMLLSKAKSGKNTVKLKIIIGWVERQHNPTKS
jgi:hypothetical protein